MKNFIKLVFILFILTILSSCELLSLLSYELGKSSASPPLFVSTDLGIIYVGGPKSDEVVKTKTYGLNILDSSNYSNSKNLFTITTNYTQQVNTQTNLLELGSNNNFLFMDPSKNFISEFSSSGILINTFNYPQISNFTYYNNSLYLISEKYLIATNQAEHYSLDVSLFISNYPVKIAFLDSQLYLITLKEDGIYCYIFSSKLEYITTRFLDSKILSINPYMRGTFYDNNFIYIIIDNHILKITSSDFVIIDITLDSSSIGYIYGDFRHSTTNDHFYISHIDKPYWGNVGISEFDNTFTYIKELIN